MEDQDGRNQLPTNTARLVFFTSVRATLKYALKHFRATHAAQGHPSFGGGAEEEDNTSNDLSLVDDICRIYNKTKPNKKDDDLVM